MVVSSAEAFAMTWEAVHQRANTTKGFGGMLFRCLRDDPATGAKAGHLVMSLRSTEFIDDAVHDKRGRQ
jgi:hypothetical protein